MILDAVISNAIHFEITPELRHRHAGFLTDLQRALEVPNPAYLQAERMGRWTRHIPKVIRCYKWDRATGEISIPRGFLAQFLVLAEHHDIRVSLKDHTKEVPCQRVESRIELRDYQVPAVQLAAASRYGGVIVAPPGSGKTEMMLEILARLGQRTLWVTNKQDLAAQARDRAADRLGIPKNEIGMIGGGRETLGYFFTIGLVQTLSRRELGRWSSEFGVVVVDECHRVPASTWTHVVNAFPARYRFGLTGTPKRRDGLHAVMHLYMGPTIYTVPAEAVQRAGGTVTPTLRVVSTGVMCQAWRRYEERLKEWEHRCEELALQGKGHKTPPKPLVPYGEIIEELLGNGPRNELITEHIARRGRGHSNLVLTSRISHGEILAKRLQAISGMRIALLHHQMSQDERARVLSDLREGRIDVLFAVDIPKEGLDVPRLDRLWLTAGGRDPILIRQSVGRIQRPHPAKRDAEVIDFVDFDIGVMAAQFYQRRRIYRQMGIQTAREARQVALRTG